MKHARWGGLALGLAAAVLAAGLRWLDPAPLQDLRAASLDVYQQLRPRPRSDTPVTIVTIDEAALQQQGQWPWPRGTLAQLTTRLFENGAAAVAYDVLFAEPDRLSPAALAKALGLPQGGPLASLPDGTISRPRGVVCDLGGGLKGEAAFPFLAGQAKVPRGFLGGAACAGLADSASGGRERSAPQRPQRPNN